MNTKSYILTKNRILKTERKRRGWTQARLAQALGVATRTVMRWEKGLALPRLNHQRQLGTLFGKSTEEIGLWWDINEYELEHLNMVPTAVMPTAPLPPLAHQTITEITEQASLLADASIPQILDVSSDLLGRTRLFMQIKELLIGAKSQPFTALYGLPGIGKTTLAAALVSDPQVQAHFGDGILWAPVGPQPHVLGQLTRWGTLLGITPDEVENPESLLAWGRVLRTAIGTRQMLLIIDDAWTAEDAQALQVGGPRCTHLLTTRHPQVAFTFAQQHAIVVPQLEEADGLALLARFISQLIQQDPEGARFLGQALGGSPLALTLMGKFLASSALIDQPLPLRLALMQLHDIQDYLRLSIPTGSGPQSFSLGEVVSFSLYAAIAMSAQQLSLHALATLSTLAIFPPKSHSFSEEAALVISQQPREILDELCETGLLECWGSGRYSLHQAIAHYIHVRTNS